MPVVKKIGLDSEGLNILGAMNLLTDEQADEGLNHYCIEEVYDLWYCVVWYLERHKPVKL